MKKVLSGNEAIALGAYESGVKVAAAYPGTPSSEILQNVAEYPGIWAEWSVNEKVALDVAIGAAYAGKRALSAMKMVGLNVAADSLFYASYTGQGQGLVIVVADDPGQHSSQNEQDTRNYGKFAKVPVLEPSDSQECKDFVGYALEISEQFDTPVILRTSTRIAHSHTLVEFDEKTGPQGDAEPKSFQRNPSKYVMVPAFARARHPVVEARIDALKEYAETLVINRIEPGSKDLGIISGGIAYQYAREVFRDASFLKLGLSYPLPERKIKEFAFSVKRLLVVEDLDPFWEEQIRLMGIEVEGKKYFPMIGELSPDVVRSGTVKAGLMEEKQLPRLEMPQLPPRPPILCPGCRHRGIFFVLNKLKAVVNGDIGCYTLGVAAPLSAIDTTGCMGASFGVVHGVDKAGIAEKAVGVLGDSTFFHSGIAPLINIVYNRGNSTAVILDNHTTAMTGHQDNPCTGKTLLGDPTEVVDIERLVRAIGVQDVRVIDPYDLPAVEAAFKGAFAYDGPSVIIATGPCVLKTREKSGVIAVDAERCNGCGLCLRVGCGAVIRVSDKLVEIDELQCTGCTLCMQMCARKAMTLVAQGG